MPSKIDIALMVVLPIVGFSQAGVAGAATGFASWLVVSAHVKAVRASLGDRRYQTIAFSAAICLDLLALWYGGWTWGWATVLAALILGFPLSRMFVVSGKALATQGIGSNPPRHMANRAANEAIQMALRTAIPALGDDVTLRAVAFEIQSEGELAGHIDMNDGATAASDAVKLVNQLVEHNRTGLDALIARHTHRLVDATAISDTLIPDVRSADAIVSIRMFEQSIDLTERAISEMVSSLGIDARTTRLCAAQCTDAAGKSSGSDSTFMLRDRAIERFRTKVAEMGDMRSAVLALAAQRRA